MEFKSNKRKLYRLYLILIVTAIIFALISASLFLGPVILNATQDGSPSEDDTTSKDVEQSNSQQPSAGQEADVESKTHSDLPSSSQSNSSGTSHRSENTQSNTVVGDSINWAIDKINARSAWSESTGLGVKIAILDTGIGPIDDVKIYGGVNFVDNTDDFTDYHGHGTMIASIVAAQHSSSLGLRGVAPAVEIYAVKIIDDPNVVNLDRAILGVEWAIKNKMQIISISWCITDVNYRLMQALDKAYSEGILIIAAAGNDDQVLHGVGYPAKYSSTIAVSAITKDSRKLEQASTGLEIELTAPGDSVSVIYLDNKLYSRSGTSYAVAYVVGTAALVWAKNPALTNMEVRDILCQTATNLSFSGSGRDITFGYGLVNAAAAVKATPSNSA
jgi:minor extracellular protease Epr